MNREPLRLVPLDRGHNFRDMGGYLTTDGRRVRWGQLYRSGSMADLTAPDFEQIARLDIKVICDLRSNHERSSRPTRSTELAGIERWARDHETSIGELVAALTLPDATSASIRSWMISAYRTLPYEQAESYRELFRRAAEGQLPLVFHCAAGKDRTGIAAALLLTALNVSRETVIEDYLLTEQFFEGTRRLVTTEQASVRLGHVEAAIWEPILRADRSYVEAMFDTLERRHGSIDGYLAQVLGLDADTMARLRRELLE